MRITIDVHPLTLVFLSFHHALHSSRSCDDAKLAKKYVVGIVTCDQIGLLRTSYYCYIFFLGKSSLQEPASFGDYPADFKRILESGNREPRQSRI